MVHIIEEQYVEGYLSGFMKRIEKRKTSVLQIVNNEENKCVYVDEKLLKEFGKELEFKIKNSEKCYNSPVAVYSRESEQLLGLVFPMMLNKQDYDLK